MSAPERWIRFYRIGEHIRCLKLGPLDFTLYPRDSAMHGALNVWVPRLGYVCVKLPNRCFGAKLPGYFYVSPDGTPNRARWHIGRAYRRRFG